MGASTSQSDSALLRRLDEALLDGPGGEAEAVQASHVHGQVSSVVQGRATATENSLRWAMSPRDQSSSLSPLTLRVLDALRDAGPEGLTLREIEIAVGTRWGGRHIRALQETPRCTIGSYRREDDTEDRCVLVADPDVGRRVDTAPSLPEDAVGKVSASSSTEPERLFPLPSAHFDWDLAA